MREHFLPPVEVASSPRFPHVPTLQAELITSTWAPSPTGTQSRGEGGLEISTVRTPPPPLTVGIYTSSSAKSIGIKVASYDRDSTPDPSTGRYASHSRRKTPYAPTASISAAAIDAYHIVGDTIGSVRAAPNPASVHGTVPNIVEACTGVVDARTATVGDTTTTPDYVATC